MAASGQRRLRTCLRLVNCRGDAINRRRRGASGASYEVPVASLTRPQVPAAPLTRPRCQRRLRCQWRLSRGEDVDSEVPAAPLARCQRRLLRGERPRPRHEERRPRRHDRLGDRGPAERLPQRAAPAEPRGQGRAEEPRERPPERRGRRRGGEDVVLVAAEQRLRQGALGLLADDVEDLEVARPPTENAVLPTNPRGTPAARSSRAR